MLEFQSLWVWSWIQRQFDWQYYVYLKFDFLRDNKSVFYYLPIREGHPAYLPSPSSQLTSQPPPWSLHSHPEFYLLGSQALRRTHQFKLCFWALPSKELLTLWTQHCNSLFMTSTNPVTETYKWISMSDTKQAPDSLPIQVCVPMFTENAMSHTVNCRVSAGPLVNDVILNKSAHTDIHKWGTCYSILFIHFNFKNEENESSPSKSQDCIS